MDIRKLDKIPGKIPYLPVKVTEAGNIIEVQYMSRRNNKQTIQMLPGGEQFVICSTGEVHDVVHHDTRNDNKKGLFKTFENARGIINANVTDVSKVRWCTLTYKDNMKDPKQLYCDFEKFNKRFQYFCGKKGYGKPEYIVMMEPQGRGAWHAHLLYIWQDQKAPFISNQDFSNLWGHGFVRIKKLDNVDNVGAYLTAYLGDMEFNQELILEFDQVKQGTSIKEVEVIGEDGKKIKKSILKGARLNLYPANFNMLRCSRGVKRPVVEMVSQMEARKKVLGATKTFEKAIELSDSSSDYNSIIITAKYNKVRKNIQGNI